MSDIHVLRGTIQDEYVSIYQFVFHFPTNASQALKDKAVLDPDVSGFVSVVPNIMSGELTDIQEGTTVEEVGTISYHSNDLPADYLARLRADWNARATDAASDFERRYQWYCNDYVANP